MIKVYLAGQPNEYENNWKKEFSDIKECEFFDWELHSDQTSPDTLMVYRVREESGACSCNSTGSKREIS